MSDNCENCKWHPVVEEKLKTVEIKQEKAETKMEEIDRRLDVKTSNRFVYWVLGILVSVLIVIFSFGVGVVKDIHASQERFYEKLNTQWEKSNDAWDKLNIELVRVQEVLKTIKSKQNEFEDELEKLKN